MIRTAMTLDQWLSIATNKLAQSSAERVRAEIQAHVEEAQADGHDPISALGDPAAANRAYRKVLLTETEEALAPSYTGTASASPARYLIAAVILFPMLLAAWKSGKLPIRFPISIAIFSTLPLTIFWPATTLERTRAHVYIHAARWVVVVGLAWWLQGLTSAALLGAVVLAADYFTLNSRLTFFRKVAAGQVVLPLPGEPRLTHNQAAFLRWSQKGVSGEVWAICFSTLMLAALAVSLPWNFAPTLAVWIAHFAARLLPIADERTGALYRKAKWTGMVLASVLPFFWNSYAPEPWNADAPWRSVLLNARAPWTPAALWIMIFLLIDARRISLRRKLPVSEWPRDLYY